jgi:DNA (cytosine-5)-methyltransferase 1
MLKNDGDIPEQYKTRKFSQRVLKRDHWGNGEPNITATSLPDDYVHYCAAAHPDGAGMGAAPALPGLVPASRASARQGASAAPETRWKASSTARCRSIRRSGMLCPLGLPQKVGKHFKTILDNALGSNA